MPDGRDTLKRNTELALKAPDEGVIIPQHVFLPPAIRGQDIRVVQDVAVSSAPPSIKDNVIRITEQCDPIGLLMAVAMGQPVACFGVDEDGKVTVNYETLPLKERMQTIRFLADKVLPRMSITKQAPPSEDNAAWEATLDNAASRS
jgi:hypothetical protein